MKISLPKSFLKQSLSLLTLSFFLLLVALAQSASVTAATLEDFGYNRMKVNGKDAVGMQPLLVILAEHQGYPALAHDSDYYDNLIFNYFATDANGNPMNNLNGYFSVISNGRFSWSRAGGQIYGPFQFMGVDLGETKGTKRQPRQALALQAAAAAGFDFSDYDDNGDGQVTNDELDVLVIENLTTDDAANRGTEPGCVRPEGSSVDVCLNIAIVGHQASLMSMGHELLHSLGAIDLYGGDQSQNYEYTLMGATIYRAPDVMRTYHLDPWHKIQLGWVEPKIHSIDSPGKESIGAAELAQGDEPVILYSPERGPNEYYLLEYRTNNRPEGAGYDANVPGSGLVVWHVKTDDNKNPISLPSQTVAGNSDYAVFINGAKNFSRGTGTPWPSQTGYFFNSYLDGLIPYSLKWIDGLGGNMKIKVGSITDNGNRLNIAWNEYVTSTPQTVAKKIFYYNEDEQSGAVGAIDSQHNHQALASYAPGAFSQWTHVVGGLTDIFYYNDQTGAGALGYVDAAGQNHTTLSIGEGYFSPGWTHIVRHKGYLFFYNSVNGMAAIGQVGQNGFTQYASYAPNSFSLDWTHIISTKNGLLFYNADNGSGAVGDWDYHYTSGAPGEFASIKSVTFKQRQGYQPYSFTTGWTHIVETADGVLFYRGSDGLQVMTDIDANGIISTRSSTVQALRAGWTHVLAANDDILFYDTNTGDGAIGKIQKGTWSYIALGVYSKLKIVRELPAFFSPGWTHITTTVDPVIIH